MFYRNIVRSNQNAVMMRNSETAEYVIVETGTGIVRYRGTLEATKKAWNRHFANSRQFVETRQHSSIF